MKKTAFTLAFSLFVFSLFAQSKFGLKIGGAFSKFRYFTNDEHYKNGSSVKGLDIGIVYGKNMTKNLLITPQLNYVQKGDISPKPLRPLEAKIHLIELAVPVEYSYPLKKIELFLNFGIFSGCIIEAYYFPVPRQGDKKFQIPLSLNSNGNEKMKRLDSGVMLGGGIGFKFNPNYSIALEFKKRQSVFYISDKKIEEELRFSFKNNSSSLNLYCYYHFD